jgi:hypothetical protein
LLDEFAWVFARVALERLLQESAARGPRQESAGDANQASASRTADIDDEKKQG